MPLEILEDIFMYSENINLVRASPLLGKFLSGLETRHAVFVYAFAPTFCGQTQTGPSDLERKANPDFQVRFHAISCYHVQESPANLICSLRSSSSPGSTCVSSPSALISVPASSQSL